MRLARRDGQGPDRRRGPLALIREHSTREVTELRFGVGRHEDLAERVDGLAARVEVLPDRLLLYTDDGEEALARGARARTRPGGGAGAAVHAGGRVPAPHRPDAGGLMAGDKVVSTGSTSGGG